MDGESVVLSAYRNALSTYFEKANEVAKAGAEATQAEEESVNALQALLRERGLVDDDNHPAAPLREIIGLQARESRTVLDELGFDDEHPVTQAVGKRFMRMMFELEQLEQHEAAARDIMGPNGNGPSMN